MTQALIKNPEQLRRMPEAGRLLAQVFNCLDGFVHHGLSTMELDAEVEHLIRHELKARPASKGQYNQPYCINTSVNEVVCHGMPHPKAVLKDGDIINIDITLEKNGYIAASSKMYLIGTVGPKAR
ncbi:type I methionyl aminopeptidase, partial [Pseudomonas sp. MWU13-2625]